MPKENMNTPCTRCGKILGDHYIDYSCPETNPGLRRMTDPKKRFLTERTPCEVTGIHESDSNGICYHCNTVVDYVEYYRSIDSMEVTYAHV
jgi:hypothetical protein